VSIVEDPNFTNIEPNTKNEHEQQFSEDKDDKQESYDKELKEETNDIVESLDTANQVTHNRNKSLKEKYVKRLSTIGEDNEINIRYIGSNDDINPNNIENLGNKEINVDIIEDNDDNNDKVNNKNNEPNNIVNDNENNKGNNSNNDHSKSGDNLVDKKRVEDIENGVKNELAEIVKKCQGKIITINNYRKS